MEVLPFVHEGLGNSSYLVALPGNAAALIDPDRTIDRYLAAAAARDWAITHVFETHLHADFLSGASEAAAATGATLFAPAGAGARFSHRPLKPGVAIPLDGVQAEALATPGHTPEHLAYVFRPPSGPPALFSGGSLIVGGAARTDLISPQLTDALTRAQFHSLTEAFNALPGGTALYPTHGGGSFCASGGGGQRTSTLAAERLHNPLLAYDSEDDFARSFPATFPAVPAYFSRMRAINQRGPRPRAEIAAPPALTPHAFEQVRPSCVVIDVRPAAEFFEGHIPGAVCIAFRDAFATWLGWLIPEGSSLLFVTGETPVERVVDEALLVGYERFAGVLEGGMTAWAAAGFAIDRETVIDPGAAQAALQSGALLLDVREPPEVAAGHIESASFIPLGSLPAELAALPRERPIITQCAAGERSATALSLLRRAGFRDVSSLRGGSEAWKEAGYSLTTP
ncbi:MAG: rhodanese-like domain-containing protein [Tepidiformaceae bacterium]